ncbi:hypothetical protein GGQ87_002005 [Brevundimonas alba]|uniref:Uncharacterized protein n=1 Tax=Brevundimonas alba TaxID=74314 RepID=A0A7X5YLC3_9CAUL|nr:hypothetical protein [Brevundimonas alba]
MLKSGVRRKWLAAGSGSIGLHLALAAAVLLARPAGAPLIPPQPIADPIEVVLFRPPPPPPPPPAVPEPRTGAPAKGGASAPPTPAPPEPEPPRASRPAPPRPAPRAARVVAPPPPRVEPLAAAVEASAPVFATVGEAQLAAATTAGSGAGQGAGSGQGTGQGPGNGPGAGGEGEGCDMVRRLQAALRADPEVRAAVAQAHRTIAPGRALLVWDGDWIQTPGQAGKGLAGVRQAIALEVAFAPEACRRQPMRGLVLITFAGGPRVAFGKGNWRWTEMLGR